MPEFQLLNYAFSIRGGSVLGNDRCGCCIGQGANGRCEAPQVFSYGLDVRQELQSFGDAVNGTGQVGIGRGRCS